MLNRQNKQPHHCKRPFLPAKSEEVGKPPECPTFDFRDKPVYVVCSVPYAVSEQFKELLHSVTDV